jgi:hypothetical protein
VTGTLYTFVFTQLPGYSLTIKIKDNPFKKTICWPVNWDEFTILNFTGMPGKKGIDGQDGLDGAPSFAVADGDDGADGWDGEDGKNGKDATILVLSYNVENMDIDGITDNTMLFIADITNKKEYLFMRKPVIIDASGGNGGEGGKGGDAGAGAEYSEYDGTMTEIIKGKDGDPGTGGNGGKGGNGGNIHLLYVQDTVLPLITVITTGGTGGKAGEHGETAGYGSIWHRGVNFDGRPGKDGQYTKKKISPDKARAICGFIENRYFEPGNILLE